jgi:lipopolysaccharide/colanic/teichoic acid biosynthesis glycosyltransferase
MQRLFDIIFSGLALILLSPLMIPLIIILRLTGEGEVFFLQSRVGLGGQLFNLYKFATMLKNSPNMGTGTVTLHKDPRILPMGGLLRRTKINELPQLINIFKGNMSIIGPRPQTQRCFDAFPVFSQKEILKVRPGLSGVGSIVFRNEEEMMHANNDPDKFYDNEVMPYKGRLEQWYVANQNIRIYFSLIGLTVWVILVSRSDMIWTILKDLPRPPKALQNWIKVP